VNYLPRGKLRQTVHLSGGKWDRLVNWQWNCNTH